MNEGSHLRCLRLFQFRRFDALEIEFHPVANIFLGRNGAGKSSILDAIEALSRGRTRQDLAGTLVRRGYREWSLSGLAQTSIQGLNEAIFIRWQDRMVRAQVNGVELPLVQLARAYPTLSIRPGLIQNFFGEPRERRAMLDWGLFHVEHRYASLWQTFQKTLKQRNAAIRANFSKKQVAPWTLRVAEFGQQIDQYRSIYIEELQTVFRDVSVFLIERSNIGINYRPGWNRTHDYHEILDESWLSDQQHGSTRLGPHRADWMFLDEGLSVRNVASWGEKKLLVIALLISQAILLGNKTGRWPTLLLDDIESELALDAQERLTTCLTSYRGQIVSAALNRSGVIERLGTGRVFHVEHGVVKENSRIEL